VLSDGGSTPPTSTKHNNATLGWRCCLCPFFQRKAVTGWSRIEMIRLSVDRFLMGLALTLG